MELGGGQRPVPTNTKPRWVLLRACFSPPDRSPPAIGWARRVERGGAPSNSYRFTSTRNLVLLIATNSVRKHELRQSWHEGSVSPVRGAFLPAAFCVTDFSGKLYSPWNAFATEDLAEAARFQLFTRVFAEMISLAYGDRTPTARTVTALRWRRGRPGGPCGSVGISVNRRVW